jgi:hypothetical protein
MSAELDFSMHAALDSIAGGSRQQQPGGDLARDVADPRFAARVWPVNTAAPQWSGLGTYDVPQAFGPKDGYAWVIRRLTAATFTAGTVNVYRGLPAGRRWCCCPGTASRSRRPLRHRSRGR